MRRTMLALGVVPAICAIAIVAAPVHSATAVQQDRHVHGWVWIGGCPQQVQNVQAIDFGLFSESVAVDPDCANGDSSASATQTSTIEAEQLTASGAGQFDAQAIQYVVIHAMARSRFDVTFHVDEPRAYSLTGTIAAARHSNTAAPGSFIFTTLSLSAGTQASGNLFNAMLQPLPNQKLSQEVAQNGVLPVGTYRIVAYLQAFVDQAFDNAWVDANGSFDITLALTPLQPGDVTGDGLVNVSDLLAVIGAWGQCPAPPTICAADITGDGIVDVQDLLMVIDNWSP